MNLFRRLFKGNDIKSEDEVRKLNEQLPADEQFAMNFTKNGGKFIYCTTEIQVQEVFRHILKENYLKYLLSLPKRVRW